MLNHKQILLLFLSLLFLQQSSAKEQKLVAEAEQAMLKATRYMVEVVSTNGGYLWYYLPDFSRQWGEMEAYKTMIWLQHPGTISMGHLFLDAYRATGDPYYYQAAVKAANALIWGQSHHGGWNYMIDFAGDRSLKQWYNTIGKNGWRLEEFQHYYGNATFDDDVTSDAARFLLRIYLEKMDPSYKPALDKAIDFILKSQYPNGGWPQRYPLRHDFNKQNRPDYTSFHTFNDDVIWENVHFLIQCYLTLGDERFLDPIHRGMNFYIIAQDGSGAWGQQLDHNMQTAGARSYEPAALMPSTTFTNAMLLLKFYQYTGERKYLDRVPDAIRWLEETRLPEQQTTVDGATHPTFIDKDTQKPVYVHRKGSNVIHGSYYTDDDDRNLLSHYGGKCHISIEQLKKEYARVTNLSIEEATKDSPLRIGQFEGIGTPQSYYDLNRLPMRMPVNKEMVREVIGALDAQHRWLTRHATVSNPYIGDGTREEQTDRYASTNVGDEADTSPYRDPSDQLYLSTGEFIRNMNLLIQYITASKTTVAQSKSVVWY